jgi:hypothetical protein
MFRIPCTSPNDNITSDTSTSSINYTSVPTSASGLYHTSRSSYSVSDSLFVLSPLAASDASDVTHYYDLDPDSIAASQGLTRFWSTSNNTVDSSSIIRSAATTSDAASIPEIIEEFLITRVITVICALGIAGNLLNLVVLTRYRLRCAGAMERLERAAHAGLAVLATSDLLFCITLLPHAFVDNTNADFTRVTFDLVYAVYRNGAINVFTMTSTWLTVSMAITRYLAVCHPLTARSVLGMTVTRLSTVTVFVVSCVFNVPRFLVESIADMSCAEGYSVYFRFPRIRSPAWLEAYGWLYFAVCIVLPLVVLVFCNVHLIRALRLASSQRRQLSMTLSASRSSENTRVLTLTLVVIVVMYVAFVVPAEFVHFLQTHVQHHWQSKPVVNMLVAVVNTMQV